MKAHRRRQDSLMMSSGQVMEVQLHLCPLLEAKEASGYKIYAVPAHYALVEARRLKPSHDPRKNFAWTKGYPKEVQGRRYDLDKNEQIKVQVFTPRS